jgi:hypothetical protein
MPEQPSIARDLFLILTRDKDGSDPSGQRPTAVRAGALMDLVLAERVTLDEAKDPLVHLQGDGPTGDVVLDDLLERLAPFEGKKISAVLGAGSALDLTKTIGDDLVRAGALTHRKGWVFTYWPQAEDGAWFEQNLRDHLGRVLRGEEEPAPHDAAELGLLKAMSQAHPQLKDQVPDRKKKDLDTRIDEIVGELASSPLMRAVTSSIDGATAAVMSAVTATTIITS